MLIHVQIPITLAAMTEDKACMLMRINLSLISSLLKVGNARLHVENCSTSCILMLTLCSGRAQHHYEASIRLITIVIRLALCRMINIIY